MRGWTLTCVFALGLAAGCGPGGQEPGQPEAQLPLLPVQLATAGLPALDELQGGLPFRRLSDTTTAIDGYPGDPNLPESNFTVYGDDNYESGSIYNLLPSGEFELSWAIYVFQDDQLRLDRPVTLQIQARIQGAPILPGGEDDLAYFVLLSDFSRHVWEIRGPCRGPVNVTLNNEEFRERYASKEAAGGPRFAFGIITAGKATHSDSDPPEEQPRVEIQSAQIVLKPNKDADYQITKPHFTQAFVAKESSAVRKPSAVEQIVIRWDHVYDPPIQKNAAREYQVARLGPGDTITSSTPMEDYVIGVQGILGSQVHADPANNKFGVPGPQPGSTYRYFVRGFNEVVGYSGWSMSAAITPDLPAVTGLTASSDLYGEVQLAWQPLDGVKGFRLLRDTDDDPAGAIVFGLLATPSFTDYTAQLDVPYYYWAQAVGEGLTLADSDDLPGPAGTAVTGQRAIVWQPGLSPDPAPSVGSFASLAVINGHPAIAYRDGTANTLKYAYSAGDGSDDWTSLVVDGVNDGGSHISLAEVNGCPAISYIRNADLRYAYSTVSNGGSGWTNLPIDIGPESISQGTSLAVIAGTPAITYRNASQQHLKFAFSTTPDGSSGWGIPVIVDNATDTGWYSSLAVVDGCPAVAFSTNASAPVHALKYARSTTADGRNTADWVTITIDGTENVGYASPLRVVGGKPAISYYDADDQTLHYAYSHTPTGMDQADWDWVVIDSGPNVGYYSSLAVIDGLPAISFFDDGGGGLKYAYSSQVDGQGGWEVVPIAAGEGQYSSLVELNGCGAVAFMQAGGGLGFKFFE